MIRHTLHLRCISLQALRLLLEKYQILSLLLFNIVQEGGDDALKVLKTLYEKVTFLVTVF